MIEAIGCDYKSRTTFGVLLERCSTGKPGPVSGAATMNDTELRINPSGRDTEVDLHANDARISSSLFSYTPLQRVAPLLVRSYRRGNGRKEAAAKSIAVMIACLTARSAAMNIRAATLADIFEPHERGTIMGISS
ncbi:hypothetical protein OE88DRAFT_1646848 [Heliocybe sulcata]|uniref:Uncharacterized protein n=1 Tax=Heliocybe sulcata TaxID=5364 RepID=A0A5C3MUL9_9AGAM|nr:hypothetical protein OE88DRAFT_1646848 [Heliocybe sulcata]